MKFGLLHNLDLPWHYQASSDGGDNANGQSDNNQQDGKQEEQGAPVSFATFNDWYNSLSDSEKLKASPAKEHFDRVYGTVHSVRDERDALAEQIQAAKKKFGNKPDWVEELDKITNQLDAANKRSAFFEQAIANECRNPKGAFAVATAGDLFKRDGTPDWTAIKKEVPEFFGRPQQSVRKSAGSGTRGDAPQTHGINEWIRDQAGVKTTE